MNGAERVKNRAGTEQASHNERVALARWELWGRYMLKGQRLKLRGSMVRRGERERAGRRDGKCVCVRERESKRDRQWARTVRTPRSAARRSLSLCIGPSDATSPSAHPTTTPPQPLLSSIRVALGAQLHSYEFAYWYTWLYHRIRGWSEGSGEAAHGGGERIKLPENFITWIYFNELLKLSSIYWAYCYIFAHLTWLNAFSTTINLFNFSFLLFNFL